jgi:membrane glycosyltransferase
MPRVGSEPTTPVFERAKAIHALDRAATVIGAMNYVTCKLWLSHVNAHYPKVISQQVNTQERVN